MPESHKIVLYRGPNIAFHGRHMCSCSVMMPRVPFGIPLNRAFADHLVAEKKMEKA